MDAVNQDLRGAGPRVVSLPASRGREEVEEDLPDGPILQGPRVKLVPVTSRHVAALWRIRSQPEVARWWGEPAAGWPFTSGDDSVGFVVLLRGSGDLVRGYAQYSEHPDPEFRHAGIDVFLHPSVHGRGLGQEVVSVVARHLVDDRGHDRLVIDPAADNDRAIACYEAVGFRPVGIMRRYERRSDGTVRDGLLMDLLAEELVRPAED